MRRQVWTAVIILATAAPLRAGVIVTEENSFPDAAGGTQKVTRTITVEGSKQKTSGTADGMVQIVDAEAGTITTLDQGSKTALEMEMSGMGAMMSGFAAPFPMKPTGVKKTVAGYSCEEYQGSGKMMMGESSVTQCVSKDAPGAAEFMAFGKKMMAKMGMSVPAGHPEGIPLLTETTTRTNLSGAFPGMPPEVAKQLAGQQATPQVTRTEVKAIEVRSVGAAAFAIPEGYKKETMENPMKGMFDGQ